MGGLDGVYLYYGYKIKESDLRDLFESGYINSKYQSLYTDDDSDDSNSSDEKSQNNSEYKFRPLSFGEYLNSIFKDVDAKEIVATTLPCCAYRKNGYWIIGKQIDHIEAFEMQRIVLPTTDDLKLIDPILEKLVADSGLSNIVIDMIPNIYAIGDECPLCS